MEQSPAIPYNRISLFFVLILAFITWGFYKTYIVFFPSFTGFNYLQHFHGAMMMTWMAFLIVQPLLIRSGKTNIHRMIGKLSYIIAPLLMVSIFLVARMVYLRVEPTVPAVEKIGLIALSIPDLVAFGVLYALAIFNRQNSYLHMRYMIGTSLLMIAPGLGRALIIYYGQSLDKAVNVTNYIAIGIAAALLLNDILKRRYYIPFTVVLIVVGFTHLMWELRLTQLWQPIGRAIASIFNDRFFKTVC